MKASEQPLRILFRRGSAAELNRCNPVLLSGEPCVELDTSRLKIGDGVTHWNDLPFVAGVVIGQAHWIEGRIRVE